MALRDDCPVVLERALVAGRRQVHDERLVEAFVARDAGAVERAYLRLEFAAIRCEASSTGLFAADRLRFGRSCRARGAFDA